MTNLALRANSLWPEDTAVLPGEVQENPSAWLPAARSDSSPRPRPAETRRTTTRMKRLDKEDRGAPNAVTVTLALPSSFIHLLIYSGTEDQVLKKPSLLKKKRERLNTRIGRKESKM